MMGRGEQGLEQRRDLGAPAVSPEVTSCQNRHMLPDPALKKISGSSASLPGWLGCAETPSPRLHVARCSRGFSLPLAAWDPVTVMLTEISGRKALLSQGRGGLPEPSGVRKGSLPSRYLLIALAPSF